MVGLSVIFGLKAIDHDKMDKLINEGVGLMGYVAFVMLIAAGFASVMKATGGIDSLVNTITPYMMSSKIIATALMLFVGLFITMGIGTSFGTIPILAVLYVPICIKLGFSIPSTIIVIAAAAALEMQALRHQIQLWVQLPDLMLTDSTITSGIPAYQHFYIIIYR